MGPAKTPALMGGAAAAALPASAYEVTKSDAIDVKEEFKRRVVNIGVVVAIGCVCKRHFECLHREREHENQYKEHDREWNHLIQCLCKHFDHKAKTFVNPKSTKKVCHAKHD